ncbi:MULTISPECIES: hypothetical protein [unclassified Legionella]|uniref:hypothetical protein n=1 Tax=unclassified Legionella TaxID=2622702 RepID=UPI001055EA09|nr:MULTISPECIES: hypothetical protein [unclassified Legionella]MDI9818293.1 hypothetical protein [Legionella sp. PL877]
MHYNLKDIIQYSRDVEEACGRTGVAARFPERSWAANKARIDSKLREFNHNRSRHTLEHYAQVINVAAQFLKNSNDNNASYLAFLSLHLRVLEQGLKELIPERNITFPSEGTISKGFGLFGLFGFNKATTTEPLINDIVEKMEAPSIS